MADQSVDLSRADEAPRRGPLWRRLHAKLFSGPAGTIFKGMATIATGAMIGKAIGFVALPVLTRLFDPASFGVLAIFNSICAFLMPLVTLRYVVAVPLPKSDAMAMNVVSLTAFISIAMTALIALALWVGGPLLFSALNIEAIAPYWWVIVLALIASVIYETLSTWATRKRSYRLIAQTTAIQSASGAVTKIALGLLSFGPIGLVIGQIVNQSGGIGSFIKRFWADFRANIGAVSMKRMQLAASAYRGFPTYRLPSQFVLIFAQQAPIIFVAAFYGAAVAGQLAIARILVSLPVDLLSTGMTKAAYGELANIGKRRPEQVRLILRTLTSRLAIVSVSVAAAIFVLAPSVLPIVLGAEWREAGFFASALSIYLVATMIAVPMTAFVNILGRQGEFLIWNSIRAVLIVALIACAAHFRLPALMFIALFAITLLVFQTGVIARTYAIVDAEVRAKQNADIVNS